ncbi:MAG: phage protease [Polaromonas sp.]
MKRNPAHTRLQVATLNFRLTTPGAEVQLLPAGEFMAADGRSQPWGTWKLTEANAPAVVALANSAANEFVIDYEHQTQLADTNGLPAPAAGWFKGVEFRPGKGLYATDVSWTARATQFIAADEYKYISAAFLFDPKTGEVQRIVCAALTNNPGLQGLDEVQLAALSARFSMAEPDTAQNSVDNPPENLMNPVLLALLKALGLTESATEVEAVSAVAVLKAKADSVPELNTQIATLKTAAPDASKYVSVDKIAELNSQIVTLKGAENLREVEAVIAQAKAEGKLVPAVEQVWRDIGTANLATLKAMAAATPGNAALAGQSQTGGQAPAQTAATLTTEQLAICKNMGLTPEQFAAGQAA